MTQRLLDALGKHSPITRRLRDGHGLRYRGSASDSCRIVYHASTTSGRAGSAMTSRLHKAPRQPQSIADPFKDPKFVRFWAFRGMKMRSEGPSGSGLASGDPGRGPSMGERRRVGCATSA